MHSNRSYRSVLIWLLLSSMAAAQPARAQSKEITLAIVKSFPDTSATATIIRESGSKGRTMILLREDEADGMALATALASLERSLKSEGEDPRNEIVITLHGLRSSSSLSAAQRQLADDYVSRLQKMEPQELLRFGRTRVLLVTLDTLRKIGDGGRGIR